MGRIEAIFNSNNQDFNSAFSLENKRSIDEIIESFPCPEEQQIIHEFATLFQKSWRIVFELSNYRQYRKAGHTKEYAEAVLFDTKLAERELFPMTNALSSLLSYNIPASWPRKEVSGVFTNDVGEIRKYTTYEIIDGELAFNYTVYPDESVRPQWVHRRVFDAKEVDPKYSEQIRAAEKWASEMMESEGSAKKFGACRRFWELKKEFLNSQGISWRSQEDLNPMTFFD